MKLLVVWYKNFGYLDSIKNAFEVNGICADKFVIEYFSDCTNLFKRILYKWEIMSNVKKDYAQNTRDAIIRKCEKEGFDNILVLTGNFTDIFDDYFFDWAKKNNKKLILWFVDSARNFSCFNKEYFKNYKKIYSFEPLDIDYFKNEYDINDVQYLPLTAAEEIYNDIKQHEKKYDICFIGVSSEKRSQLLEQVAKYCTQNNKTMVVYGQFWRFRPFYHKIRYKNKFKKKNPYLYKFVINKFLKPKDVARIYKQSKICLNIVQPTQSAANPRTFEILATNSFQIVDYHKHINELFEDKKELVMYNNSQEIIDLIKYYLNNEKERNDIAENGFEKVQKKFLLKETVKKIIDDNFI